MANYPAFVQSLMNSAPGSIDRRFPKYWNDGEGGLDWSASPGTPVVALADGQVVGAGYFCNASHQYRLTSDSGACGHGVITTRVQNQDGSKTDLYYQHIILHSDVRPCFDGAKSCGGQTVKKGQVIGYISDFGMLEMGINVGNVAGNPPYPTGWGGIWGQDPSPGPHIDPENYLRALISGANITGPVTGVGLAGTGTPGGLLNITPADFLPKGLLDWISNPIRLIKMLVGIALVAIGLFMLIAPEAAKEAVKHPEVFLGA